MLKMKNLDRDRVGRLARAAEWGAKGKKSFLSTSATSTSNAETGRSHDRAIVFSLTASRVLPSRWHPQLRGHWRGRVDRRGRPTVMRTLQCNPRKPDRKFLQFHNQRRCAVSTPGYRSTRARSSTSVEPHSVSPPEQKDRFCERPDQLAARDTQPGGSTNLQNPLGWRVRSGDART